MQRQRQRNQACGGGGRAKKTGEQTDGLGRQAGGQEAAGDKQAGGGWQTDGLVSARRRAEARQTGGQGRVGAG